jgi:hypothetical protein
MTVDPSTIDWNSPDIDWAKGNAAISKQTGVAVTTVSAYRKRLGKPAPPKRPIAEGNSSMECNVCKRRKTISKMVIPIGKTRMVKCGNCGDRATLHTCRPPKQREEHTKSPRALNLGIRRRA